MKTIKRFDDENYQLEWKRTIRSAVRAVIVRGNKIALVKSRQEGFYKFPGGGIEKGETHLQTLIRETEEEVGLQIIPETVRELGMVQEIRKGIYGEEIFEQNSYYYTAEVKDEQTAQKLNEYERRLGYELIWEDIRVAYETNMELDKKYETSFLLRESFVLESLLQG